MSEDDEHIVNAVEAIAKRHYAIADALMDSVTKCRIRQTAKGIDEMVAYSFNAAGIDPRFGVGGGLPLGKHPVTITNSEAKVTKDQQGGYIELTCTAFDGPAKGQSQPIRLNLNNKSQDAVRIANQQLAAICAVVQHLQFQDFAELYNKPFVIEVGPQKDSTFTEVVAVFDMNGNEPGKAGGGAMQGGNAGGGFQQPNNAGQQGGGFPQQNNGGAQQGNAGGAWGQQGNAGGQPQNDPNAGQQNGGAGGAWGQQGGAQQGNQPNNPQQGGGNAGWAQGGAAGGQQNGGGSPGWGQR